MSFVITVYVREGIVMATDSRLTLNRQEQQGDRAVLNMAIGQSDSNYKLFLTPHNVGISTFGAAAIQGVPIAGYVESFIAADLGVRPRTVEEVARKLLAHFGAYDPVPETQFHVSGYSKLGNSLEQEVWQVNVAGAQVSRLNPPGQQGASWGGEADILARLIKPVAEIEGDRIVNRFPALPVLWQFFTLQDAIDFTVFAVRSTIDAIRFQPRPKTVGGPVDVLVIKPDGATWIQRKELRADR